MVRVSVSRYHGKGVFAPGAADEDNILSRNAEFVLAFDGLSGFGRGIGFFAMCLEESRNGKDAAPMLHGFLPSWLRGAFDSCVKHDSWFPGFLEPHESSRTPSDLAAKAGSDVLDDSAAEVDVGG